MWHTNGHLIFLDHLSRGACKHAGRASWTRARTVDCFETVATVPALRIQVLAGFEVQLSMGTQSNATLQRRTLGLTFDALLTETRNVSLADDVDYKEKPVNRPDSTPGR